LRAQEQHPDIWQGISLHGFFSALISALSPSTIVKTQKPLSFFPMIGSTSIQIYFMFFKIHQVMPTNNIFFKILLFII
jgi:hypothetical protein